MEMPSDLNEHDESIIPYLSSIITTTPTWLQFFFTSCPNRQVSFYLQSYSPSISLDEHVQETKQDIREFIVRHGTLPSANKQAFCCF